ncbi:hypothetical protein [Allobranchiibius sp. GilTou73]|uniref:hypothetical protein n=1 Tax=Allobranchiibius sp. GilTou73 TaxID=2904523 RepID=UPI001F3EC185|nr:hypothetical protein [Allobranchiibius sp. GilTou73]UIJ35036.1 hypothetical protein LVQ62_01075 [Allobranchiibius sp. GilTou73]
MSDNGRYGPPPPGGEPPTGPPGSPQDRYYQRYSQSSGPLDRQPRRGPGRWLALGAGALVVVLVAVLGFILFGANGKGDAVTSSSSTAPSPRSASSGTPSSGTTSTAADGALSVRPVVPGWQAVGGIVTSDFQIYGAYDAPPGWQVKQSNNIYFDDADGTGIEGEHTDWGLAAYNLGKCSGYSNSPQASASFIDIGKRDPAEAVGSLLVDFGSAASINKDKTTHAAQGSPVTTNFTVANGSIPAVRGQLTVTEGTLNADCGVGKAITFYAAAFTSNGRSVMLLVTVGTWPGVPGPSSSTITTMLQSLRPAGG